MKSLNYRDWQWLFRNQNVKDEPGDPYKALTFESLGLNFATLDGRDDINFDGDGGKNGGAAMTAYKIMHFESSSNEEKKVLIESLKRYCELDTLAMAMICQYFLNDVVAAEDMTKKGSRKTKRRPKDT